MTTATSTVRTAFEAIGRNLLRSALTSLGIIIGVAAVIVMMAIGGGARASINRQVSSLGTNIVTVSAGSANVGGVRTGQGAVTTLTDDDVGRAGADSHDVRAEAGDLAVDRSSRAAANRHHHDHGGDADDDAERGERRT